MNFIYLLVTRVYAAGADSVVPIISPVGNASGSVGATTAINSIFASVLSIITLLAGILAVFYLIWAGIRYITSAGNPEQAKVARQGIINAVIGIIIIVAAYVIIRFAVGIGKTAACSDQQSAVERAKCEQSQ